MKEFLINGFTTREFTRLILLASELRRSVDHVLGELVEQIARGDNDKMHDLRARFIQLGKLDEADRVLAMLERGEP